ncbi:hypothetical protein CC1G_15610 [Coprinopsis cinerea okayama7|uniref:Uncharacterized protein n=1 Tax=Coprinopsis cinerea (strain Okayama-7 / 130 / ATCC MYA-4618 / FGSC 9003) TaxID=240176 RepID=D6RNE0_COPC7|nr:hypothetical protein CC1G_15610 [Coprinopsis cinerea okayama7\|eukprot:XP_002911068.1 hypothetical protein CC1G_15610 [Coprinopsis cinerea okayama7\
MMTMMRKTGAKGTREKGMREMRAKGTGTQAEIRLGMINTEMRMGVMEITIVTNRNRRRRRVIDSLNELMLTSRPKMEEGRGRSSRFASLTAVYQYGSEESSLGGVGLDYRWAKGHAGSGTKKKIV